MPKEQLIKEILSGHLYMNDCLEAFERINATPNEVMQVAGFRIATLFKNYLRGHYVAG